MSSDIVPFGKYKGRPVVDLIADRSYTDWLAAQPWFRERYATVYNLIVNTGGEPQDTPEHNKMQARFLDHDTSLSLLRRWLPDADQLRGQWSENHGNRLTPRQRANVDIGGPFATRIGCLAFESHGWDLVAVGRSWIPVNQRSNDFACECACEPARCGVRQDWRSGEPAQITEDPKDWSECFGWSDRRRHCAPDCPATWVSEYSNSYTKYEDAVSDRVMFHECAVAVELKPALGDDYPSVLREVVKRRELFRARGMHHAFGLLNELFSWVVLTDETNFEGVDQAAVRKIFRSQKVDLITTAELPAPSSEWRCSCNECTAP